MNNQIQRNSRFTSHALAEVRKFKNLPIFCHSAILLDLSITGFKLEFTNSVKSRTGSLYWLYIPLSPLGIFNKGSIILPIECRWVDHDRNRIGGVFRSLDSSQSVVLTSVIEALEAKAH